MPNCLCSVVNRDGTTTIFALYEHRRSVGKSLRWDCLRKFWWFLLVLPGRDLTVEFSSGPMCFSCRAETGSSP